MLRAFVRMVLAALVLPTVALAQDAAYNDALGHAMHGYYAGRLLEAQSELSQLIVIGPTDPRAYYFRGLSAWQMGRTAEAQRDFARGAELEQADPQLWSDVSASLARVQGASRRMLENHRAPVRLALAQKRDAQRLAFYGIGPSRPPVEQVAAIAAPQRPADALPMPAAAPATAPANDAAEDPFAAPPAAAKPAASAAENPFAAPSTPAATSATAATEKPAADAMPPAAAAAESAPAATPAPVADPLAAANPPAAETPAAAATADASTPEGTVAAAIAAIDQPQNLWPLLPASYQADIKGLVNQFGGKMDAELWDRTFAVLKKLVKVGKEKRELILKQPMLAAVPVTGGKEQLTQNWDRGMDLLETLFTSEISTVEGLKTFDPAAFLAGTGGKIAKLVADAPPSTAGEPALAQLKAAKVSTAKTEGDTATVAVTVEGKTPVEVTLKQVDGKWLPAKMVDGWSGSIFVAKAGLEQLNVAAQKPQGMMMLQMADGVLDQLLAAKDEAAFNAALAPIIGLLGQFGGAGPAGGGMPFPGGPPMVPGGAPPMGPPGAPPANPAP